MKLTIFLSTVIILYSINASSQTIATTTLTSGGLNSGTTGTQNTFYGYQAGKNNSSGNNNTFVGDKSGVLNTTGSSNLFHGAYSGISNTTGGNNTYIGTNTGDMNNGNNNTFIGSGAGSGYEGNENIFLGIDTGHAASGNSNIFIGNGVGFGQYTNHKLFIDNSSTYAPLIWGDFAQDRLKFNGKVGIGNGFGNFPSVVGSASVLGYNLFVLGGILTEEVRVNLNMDWADYVFTPQYELKTLEEVETFIKENGHLKNVPSAKQVREDGIELGEIAKIQQEKIEELTLYVIELNKENKAMQKKLLELEEKINNSITKN